MTRRLAVWVLLAVAWVGVAAAQAVDEAVESFTPMKVVRDVPYASMPDVDPELLSLDVYSPVPEGTYPVLVMIHGGGWSGGDKGTPPTGIQKANFFVGQGFVYVSVNYRLSPEVKHPAHVEDVAKAVAWVHDRIAGYGGDPGRVFVIGHSAGAHLAALVATDERRLGALGKPISIVKGVVLLDGAGYDVPAEFSETMPWNFHYFRDAFGNDIEVQRDASPVNHVAAGKGIPPFLIVYVAWRGDSRAQALEFAEALRKAGVETSVVAARWKTHNSLNRDIGRPGDAPTEGVMEFLGKHAG